MGMHIMSVYRRGEIPPFQMKEHCADATNYNAIRTTNMPLYISYTTIINLHHEIVVVDGGRGTTSAIKRSWLSSTDHIKSTHVTSIHTYNSIFIINLSLHQEQEYCSDHNINLRVHQSIYKYLTINITKKSSYLSNLHVPWKRQSCAEL